MLVPTTGGDNYHIARQNYITYNKNKHASLTKEHITQNQHTELKPGLVTSYDIRPGNGVGLFW